jgi:hypothetical protein
LREARIARGAQRIEAEILFYRWAVKKIGAESLVFGASACWSQFCGAKLLLAMQAPKMRTYLS